MSIGGADGADENNWDVFRAFSLADHFRCLEPGDSGHVHVQQNHGEFLAQKQAQSFLSGARLDDILSELGEHGFERDQVFRSVIDQKNVRLWMIRASAGWGLFSASSPACWLLQRLSRRFRAAG